MSSRFLPVSVVGLTGSRARAIIPVVQLATQRPIVEVPTPSGLPPQSDVIICGEEHLRDVCKHESPVVVWGAETSLELVRLVSEQPQVCSLIGWRDGDEIPRVWELAYALQRAVGLTSAPISVTAPLEWSGLGHTWCPLSTSDLYTTLEEIEKLLGQVAIDRRTSGRVVGVAHEMLMNAMYDAPTLNGSQRFAHDRTQQITLQKEEAPNLTLGLDGASVTLQVVDSFGGLRRDHVFASLIRGLASRDREGGDVIDTSGGGAGLGLHRIVFEASATIFDVLELGATRVTSLFDLGIPNRERHRQPKSIHFFHQA